MHWELGLSLEQQQKVEAAMQKYRPELDAVIRETFPRVKAVQEKIDNEIRALLTEGQRRKFDEMQSRRPPGAGSRPGPDSPYPGGPPPFMPSGHRFGPPGEMPPPSMSAPIAPPKG
jgi:Spy/CpxP family protein refolding chaperone